MPVHAFCWQRLQQPTVIARRRGWRACHEPLAHGLAKRKTRNAKAWSARRSLAGGGGKMGGSARARRTGRGRVHRGCLGYTSSLWSTVGIHHCKRCNPASGRPVSVGGRRPAAYAAGRPRARRARVRGSRARRRPRSGRQGKVDRAIMWWRGPSPRRRPAMGSSSGGKVRSAWEPLAPHSCSLASSDGGLGADCPPGDRALHGERTMSHAAGGALFPLHSALPSMLGANEFHWNANSIPPPCEATAAAWQRCAEPPPHCMMETWRREGARQRCMAQLTVRSGCRK